MIVREETEQDREMVRTVNVAAFETASEADLVDALRAQADPVVSFVAEDNGEVVGHILFTPMTAPEHPHFKIMGLAPMAVLPDRQKQGVGSAMVREGLEHCRRLRSAAVVVLGHPEYYPRFGFEPASRFGIKSEYDVPDEVFMAMELQPGALDGIEGTVKYHPAFNETG